jgi:hypothetical protein
MTLRYGPRTPGRAALQMPPHRVDALFEMVQGTALLQLELPALSPNEPLWLTLERDACHEKDNYPATARLLDLAFVHGAREAT